MPPDRFTPGDASRVQDWPEDRVVSICLRDGGADFIGGERGIQGCAHARVGHRVEDGPMNHVVRVHVLGRRG
jgi:hypothetical protein